MSELTAADYEEVLADHRRLVRELDVLLNGDGAAQQASLCDIVAQVAHRPNSLGRFWPREGNQICDCGMGISPPPGNSIVPRG